MHARFRLLLALGVRWVLAALQNVFHAVVGDALQWLEQSVTRVSGAGSFCVNVAVVAES